MLYALLLAFVLSSSNSCARLCLQGFAGGMAMFGGGPPPVTGLGSPPPSYGYGTPPPAGSDDAPRLGYFVSFSVQPVMSSGHDEQCAACWLHSTSTKQCSSVLLLCLPLLFIALYVCVLAANHLMLPSAPVQFNGQPCTPIPPPPSPPSPPPPSEVPSICRSLLHIEPWPWMPCGSLLQHRAL